MSRRSGQLGRRPARYCITQSFSNRPPPNRACDFPRTRLSGSSFTILSPSYLPAWMSSWHPLQTGRVFPPIACGCGASRSPPRFRIAHISRSSDRHSIRLVFLVGDTILLLYPADTGLVLARERLRERNLQDPREVTHPLADIRRHAVVVMKSPQDGLIALNDRVIALGEQFRPVDDLPHRLPRCQRSTATACPRMRRCEATWRW